MIAGYNFGKSVASDYQIHASPWRRWLRPLKSVQESSSPPLDIVQLETAIDSAISSADAKFRNTILGTAKTALSSARKTLASEFETHNDGAVYVGRHAWIMDILVRFIVAQASKRFGLDHKKHRMVVVAVGGG